VKPRDIEMQMLIDASIVFGALSSTILIHMFLMRAFVNVNRKTIKTMKDNENGTE
jgi:hypothetical protein